MYVHCNREHHQLNVDKFDGNYNMYVCSKVNDNRSTFLFWLSVLQNVAGYVTVYRLIMCRTYLQLKLWTF